MSAPTRILATSIALILSSTSCAVILHPERKGNNSAPIDTVPLVVDILLFLPGLIPGVVAMVLDFGTGAIYLSKDGANKPFLGKAKSQQLHVEVVDDDGVVLERRALMVAPPTNTDEPMTLSVPGLSAEQFAGRSVHVRVMTEGSEPVTIANRDPLWAQASPIGR